MTRPGPARAIPWRTIALLAPATLIVAGVAAPLVHLVLQASSGAPEALVGTVARPRTLHLLATTAALAAVVSTGSLALGLALAWTATRIRLPGRRFWWIALCLPLAVPSFVSAFAWVSMWPTLTGFWPLALVLILTTVPYVTVPAMAAIATADHSLADAARTLGRGPIRAIATTTLPQVLPAATAGALLVALYALSDFGAPAILRVETLTTGVYAQSAGGFGRDRANALALVLVLIAVVCVTVEQRFRRAGGMRRSPSRRPAPHRPGPRGTAAVFLALATVSVAGVAFPVTALALRMLRSDRYTSAPADLGGALVTTALISGAAATLTVLAALPLAIVASRTRGRIVRLFEALSSTGHALPGIVVALALVSLSLALVPGVYQTVVLLLVAYVILFLPKALGSTRSALTAVPPATQEVARTLGSSPVAVWRRVTLPLSLPGLLAAWVLVATATAKELPATLLLRPIGVETLATELWMKTSLGAYGAAAPLGLLLILVGVVPAWWLARSLERTIPR